MLLHYLKTRNPDRHFTSCPYQFWTKDKRFKCNADFGECITMDIYACRYIPQAMLWIIEVCNWITSKCWRRIKHKVKETRNDKTHI